MDRRTPIILLAAVLIAVGLFLAARSCAGPVPPPTPTPTLPAPPTPLPVTIHAPTVTPKPPATGAPATATLTVAPTLAAPTLAAPSATPVPTGTPDLLGHHRVARGETMYGIGLWWYRGMYLPWGDDVWRGICDANPQIANCRMIYPGDVLAIPAKR